MPDKRSDISLLYESVVTILVLPGPFGCLTVKGAGDLKNDPGVIALQFKDSLGREHIHAQRASAYEMRVPVADQFYNERFRKADAKLNRLKAEKQDRLMRVCSVKKYVENLRGQAGPIEVWYEQAWCLLVTQVTVHADGSAEFLFRGENRITVK